MPVSPEDPLRPVRYWLLAIAAMVVAMILIGGATRLTDSGLSITEWAPISGAVPPLSAADWAEEFELYKRTTEYQTVNRGMSLADFQFIYWWEWGHRQWGRLMGLAFALPLAFFWWTGRLTPYLKPRLLLLLAMGASQGAIGWWMVRSGLTQRVDVSHYRLAVHLTMASVIFAYALWLARAGMARSQAGSRWQPAALVILVLAQIALGGLVAGLDAGLAYNTWPLMDGALVPAGLNPTGDLARLFDDAKTVQFVHRMSAYLLLAATAAHALDARLRFGGAYARGALVLLALVVAQAMIGVATLVTQVPIGWALAHQLGAIVVLGHAVLHWRAVGPMTAGVSLPEGARTA